MHAKQLQKLKTFPKGKIRFRPQYTAPQEVKSGPSIGCHVRPVASTPELAPSPYRHVMTCGINIIYVYIYMKYLYYIKHIMRIYIYLVSSKLYRLHISRDSSLLPNASSSMGSSSEHPEALQMPLRGGQEDHQQQEHH